MKVVHSVRVTPERCGLYETTRELVAALREAGVDSRMIDIDGKATGTDRGALIAPVGFVDECDVIISHSGVTQRQFDTGKPIVHIMHGRPRSSFLLELSGKLAIYSFLRARAGCERYKAFVTFWPEHVPYWSVILPPEKIMVVPPPVDLKRWTPDGPKGYGFHGHKGAINVVCTDAWREDKDPFHMVNAYAIFARKHPDARLHIFGNSANQKGWEVLFKVLREMGALGEIGGWVHGLANVYRAADFSITPQRIATRSVREALACGCPIVAPLNNEYTKWRADEELPECMADSMECAWDWIAVHRQEAREAARKQAEKLFDPIESARQFIGVLEKVVK